MLGLSIGEIYSVESRVVWVEVAIEDADRADIARKETLSGFVLDEKWVISESKQEDTSFRFASRTIMKDMVIGDKTYKVPSVLRWYFQAPASWSAE
jgi:hypothetical protein